MNRYTSEKIVSLEPNEIFVFGSNLAGGHGAGAALIARKKFGAVNGIGEGLMGNSYAIPTKDKTLKVLPLHIIEIYIIRFLNFALDNPHLIFLVTKIGCGLAKYRVTQIGPLFTKYELPPNIILPKEFHEKTTE